MDEDQTDVAPLTKPPEGVVKGENVPRENEEDEVERMEREAERLERRFLDVKESEQ